MRRRVPDTQKIKATVGWQPTISLDETLDQVIAQFRAARRVHAKVVMLRPA
jgi:nucleoside-diphosphate-sugar epimerase